MRHYFQDVHLALGITDGRYKAKFVATDVKNQDPRATANTNLVRLSEGRLYVREIAPDRPYRLAEPIIEGLGCRRPPLRELPQWSSTDHSHE
jgi:hypothetical protein